MATPKAATCPEGHEVSAVDTECPVCKTILWPTDAVPRAPTAEFPRFPGYEVRAKLGEGGMGEVFRAFNVELKREEAIKRVRGQSFAGASQRALFRNEAESIARLKHPHIVPIYQVGETDGCPFFAMEFVEGGTLAGLLANKRFSEYEAAQLIEKLARAIDVAHRRGIVHLDLKLENVLLTEAGEPKISDFGLARPIENDDAPVSAWVGGTPGYMAPEQFAKSEVRIGPHSDIFALGAMLYRLLTGRLPHDLSAVTHGEARTIGAWRGLLTNIYDGPIPPPRQINPAVSPDLQAICLKCLETDPARRYASAADLADDLRRFLNFEPVRARPIGAWQRTLKWMQRRPALAGMLGLLLLAIVLAGFGGFMAKLWNDANVARRAEKEARDKLQDAHKQLERLTYGQRINLAQVSWEKGQVALARELLANCDPAHRRIEWAYLNKIINADVLSLTGHKRGVMSVAFSPDGRYLASGGSDNVIKVWNASTFKELHHLAGHQAQVYSVVFSPDGRYLASAGFDKAIKIWDIAKGTEHKTLSTAKLYTLAFSPDGSSLAVCCEGGSVELWDWSAGVRTQKLAADQKRTLAVAFSPDKQHLVSAGNDGLVVVWDLGTGQRKHALSGHKSGISSVAISPDGKWIASGGGDETAIIWDFATGKLRRRLVGHAGDVLSVVFAPNSKHVFTSGRDRTIKLWDADKGIDLHTFRGHNDLVTSVAVKPDGKTIASAGWDSLVKVWPVPEFADSPGKGSMAVAFSHDSHWFAAGQENDIVLGGLETRTEEFRLKGHTMPVAAIAFARNRPLLVSAGFDDTVRTWDLVTREQKICFRGHKSYVVSLAVSSDGSRIASAGNDRVIRVWDTDTGNIALTLTGHAELVHGLAFSPDGKHIASAGYDQSVKLWDSTTGEELRSLSGHTSEVASVAFSPDGKWLASASWDRTIRLWDVQTGTEIRKLIGHNGQVFTVSFATGGERLLSGASDGTIKIWDAHTGQELVSLHGHRGRVHSLAASADAALILSGGEAPALRWWQAKH